MLISIAHCNLLGIKLRSFLSLLCCKKLWHTTVVFPHPFPKKSQKGEKNQHRRLLSSLVLFRTFQQGREIFKMLSIKKIKFPYLFTIHNCNNGISKNSFFYLTLISRQNRGKLFLSQNNRGLRLVSGKRTVLKMPSIQNQTEVTDIFF